MSYHSDCVIYKCSGRGVGFTRFCWEHWTALTGQRPNALPTDRETHGFLWANVPPHGTTPKAVIKFANDRLIDPGVEPPPMTDMLDDILGSATPPALDDLLGPAQMDLNDLLGNPRQTDIADML